MKLIVISICKDESQTIGKVLDAVPKKIIGITSIDKIVIDDGSKDTTAKVAEKHGAKVFRDGSNKKLAFRFREAVDIALHSNADVLITIDGDLQFNPQDISLLVKPIVDGVADFVAADRFTDQTSGQKFRPKHMPIGKYFGNRLGTWVTGKLSGQSFNDVTCGFRAYNRKALLSLNTNGTHTYTQETFQILAMKRVRIVSIPVIVKYYPGRKSRVVTSIPRYMAISIVNILRAYRDFAPLRFFAWLGLGPFIAGVLCGGFTLVHWWITQEFSPYKFIAFSGVYLMTLGLILWIVGLLADMQVRLLNNQEKMYESLKEIKWPKQQK